MGTAQDRVTPGQVAPTLWVEKVGKLLYSHSWSLLRYPTMSVTRPHVLVDQIVQSRSPAVSHQSKTERNQPPFQLTHSPGSTEPSEPCHDPMVFWEPGENFDLTLGFPTGCPRELLQTANGSGWAIGTTRRRRGWRAVDDRESWGSSVHGAELWQSP